jgi:hypothetical protein
MNIRKFVLLTSVLAVSIALTAALRATTIDLVNRDAYGANIGWMDWVANTNNGAVMGDYVCSGYIYSANVGWINLGSGSPTNGIYYQNLSTNDFGVNQDGYGDLSGYAWGANIGWITFEQTYGKPNVNLRTGALSGYVWSANCGWISLSNAEAYVQSDYLSPGPLAPNGLPVAWLLSEFGTTNISANADPTGKGMTIAQDYVAGTNPNNVNSVLKITAESFGLGYNPSLTWESVPTRQYYILASTNLLTGAWVGSPLGLITPASGSSITTTTNYFQTTMRAAQFFRVQAVVPLSQP